MKRIIVFTLFMELLLTTFGQKVSILDPSLKWNIGTHCVKEEPIDPYDKWATSFLHTEGDTLMNEKHYKKLISCADSFCVKKSLKSFIREESGKVFLSNKTEELLQFDFNLQQGDTMIMDFLQNTERDIRLYIRIDSVKSIALLGNTKRIVQYVTVFDYYNSRLQEYSINDAFVEGIGSLKFGLEYPIQLFITGSIGCRQNLLCFNSGDDLIYTNPEYNSCYLHTGIEQVVQQPELVLVSAANFGILKVQLIKSRSGRLFIFDLNGKLIFWQAVNQSENQFCLPSIGVYLYRFVSDNGEVQTGKVMVK